ncbi:protein of unknown function [Streptomyces sp. KY75]|nr:protein of unknown function [Streptomyces sp. KY70]CAD5987445.1 protein of unknown function [Streptomyces sp. KY75]
MRGLPPRGFLPVTSMEKRSRVTGIAANSSGGIRPRASEADECAFPFCARPGPAATGWLRAGPRPGPAGCEARPRRRLTTVLLSVGPVVPPAIWHASGMAISGWKHGIWQSSNLRLSVQLIGTLGRSRAPTPPALVCGRSKGEQ